MPGGRPTDYRAEYCELILSDEYRGKHIYQIASKLGVVTSSLYEWAALYPEFSSALTRARETRLSMLIEEADGHRVTVSEGNKRINFDGKTNIEYLKLSGMGRRLPALKGITNEHEALQLVQEALAREEILPEYAESMNKVILGKLEARKVNEMANDLQMIKEKLGLK